MKNASQIELEVEKILLAHSVCSAPVPIEEIARRENILIGTAEAKDVSGVLFRKEGVAFIALNSKEPAVRQRFTLAHELGHYFMHQNRKTFVEYRDNKEQKNTEERIERSPKEIEANKFAAALLMPKKFLLEDIAAFGSSGLNEGYVSALAQKYGVSDPAMVYRLMNLSTI
jgi:Zn-dependent peptidase ImmA (M78 family)